VRALFYYDAPSWSGSARAFAAYGRGLAERGYHVTFVCQKGPVEARIDAEGGDVVPLELGSGTLTGAAWQLRRVLHDRFIETIFVHGQREHLAAALATRWAKRGSIIRRTPTGGRLVAGRSTRLAARLASTSYLFTTAGDAQTAPVIPRAREIVTVDLGVEASRYDEIRAADPLSLGATDEADGRLLVCVYDASGKARAATVIRAVAMLAPRHPELHLVLFGSGANHEDLRMHAAALGIGPVVTHVERRDDDLAVLRAADIGWVVAGEDNAAFGALDFMAMRTPVLVERGTVAARYVADGITGCVLPPGDTPAVAATIAELLAQPEQRAAMGSAGRARVVREYGESAMLDSLQTAVESARDRTQWKAR
jgi:glycosyltransferase involved in cell wall biosynthesis